MTSRLKSKEPRSAYSKLVFKITKAMEGKGFPGIALYDLKTHEIIAYDKDIKEVIRQAEEKGYKRDEYIAATILDSEKTYIFAAA